MDEEETEAKKKKADEWKTSFLIGGYRWSAGRTHSRGPQPSPPGPLGSAESSRNQSWRAGAVDIHRCFRPVVSFQTPDLFNKMSSQSLSQALADLSHFQLPNQESNRSDMWHQVTSEGLHPCVMEVMDAWLRSDFTMMGPGTTVVVYWCYSKIIQFFWDYLCTFINTKRKNIQIK